MPNIQPIPGHVYKVKKNNQTPDPWPVNVEDIPSDASVTVVLTQGNEKWKGKLNKSTTPPQIEFDGVLGPGTPTDGTALIQVTITRPLQGPVTTDRGNFDIEVEI